MEVGRLKEVKPTPFSYFFSYIFEDLIHIQELHGFTPFLLKQIVRVGIDRQCRQTLERLPILTLKVLDYAALCQLWNTIP